MKLPIPIVSGGTSITDVELSAPTPAVIADVQEEIERHGVYRAVLRFTQGVVASMSGTQDGSPVKLDSRAEIKAVCERMPYQSANVVVVYSLLEDDEDDGIEGIYECPRCGDQVVHEFVDDDHDSRDHLREIPVTMSAVAECPEFVMTQPVEVAPASVTGNTQAIVATRFRMRFPTLADCIEAEQKDRKAPAMRQQMAIFSEALETINGEDVRPFRSTYGMRLFGGMSKADYRQLSVDVQGVGLQNRVAIVCPKCGKRFDAVVNTSNFFASALAS